MRKLVSMTEEVRKARETTPAVGIARDLDIVAEREFKGQAVKAILHDGSEVTGKIQYVTRFNGILVGILLKDGSRRIAKMDKCRVWDQR